MSAVLICSSEGIFTVWYIEPVLNIDLLLQRSLCFEIENKVLKVSFFFGFGAIKTKAVSKLVILNVFGKLCRRVFLYFFLFCFDVEG